MDVVMLMKEQLEGRGTTVFQDPVGEVVQKKFKRWQ
jgi:hypothetical protein